MTQHDREPGQDNGQPPGLTLTNWDLGGDPSAWAYAHAGERYPRMRPTDLHLLMSVTKVFASAAVGILERRGLLDLSQPVDAVLPELAGSGWAGDLFKGGFGGQGLYVSPAGTWSSRSPESRSRTARRTSSAGTAAVWP